MPVRVTFVVTLPNNSWNIPPFRSLILSSLVVSSAGRVLHISAYYTPLMSSRTPSQTVVVVIVGRILRIRVMGVIALFASMTNIIVGFSLRTCRCSKRQMTMNDRSVRLRVGYSFALLDDSRNRRAKVTRAGRDVDRDQPPDPTGDQPRLDHHRDHGGVVSAPLPCA